MRNRIVAALKNSDKPAHRMAASDIDQNFIFDFPCIRELAFATMVMVASVNAPAEPRQTRVAEIKEMVEEYTTGLPFYRGPKEAPASHNDIVVLLTGSTGNIGSHILASLLRDPRIKTVYALNRPSSGRASENRLFKAFQDRNLPVELLSQDKLISITGDLTQGYFGLPKLLFQEVRSNTPSVC